MQDSLEGSIICQISFGGGETPETTMPKEHVAVMQYKASDCKQLGVVFEFGCGDDAVYCNFGAQRIYEVLQMSMAAGDHDLKDCRIKELASFLFRRLYGCRDVEKCRLLPPALLGVDSEKLGALL